MMQNIKEFVRILKNRNIIFSCFFLFLANLAVLFLSEKQQNGNTFFSADIYRDAYERVSQQKVDEAYKYLQEEVERLSTQDENIDVYRLYTFREILNEVEQCISYPQYLDRIQEDAAKRHSISLFDDDNSYSSKNIDKTAEVFKDIPRQVLPIGPSRAIKLISESVSINLIGIMMIFMFATCLIFDERNLGVWRLVHGAKNGRLNSALAKAGAMLFAIIIELIGLYLPAGIVAGRMYGFGNILRPIQSVYMYSSTELQMNVLEYLLIYFLIKVVTYWLIGLIFLLVFQLISSVVLTTIISVIAVGIETALFYVIQISSPVMALSRINIFSWAMTYPLLKSYQNICVFGIPVDYKIISAILLPVILLVILAVFVFGYVKGTALKAVDISWIHIPSAGRGELFKIFVKEKVIIILLLGIVFIWYFYSPIKSMYKDIEESYDLICVREVEGEFSQEKLLYLEERMLSEESNLKREAYMRLYDRGLQMESLPGAAFFYQKGYEYMTGANLSEELTMMMEAMMLLILSTFGIWTVETTTGMDRILTITAQGKKKIYRRKTVIALAVSIVVYFAVYTPWYINLIKVFGRSYLDRPAYLLDNLSLISQGVSIFAAVLVLALLKLLLLIAAVFIVRGLAGKVKSKMMTITVSLIILVLPFLIIKLAGGLI